MQIGFVGLGVMGAPMAANVIAAGHEVSLHRNALDLPLPHTATTHQLMNAAIAQGPGDADHSVLFPVLANVSTGGAE